MLKIKCFVNEFVEDLVWSQCCKCTGRTSNKSGPISPDIIPTEIEKNLKFNYPNYSSSTLFELPFHKIFSNLTRILLFKFLHL